MQHRRYKALGITSSRKTKNTHLWWEVSGNLYIVDSVDPTKVYKSTDKGDNWTQIDIDPGDASGDNKSRGSDIQCGWHDAANERIYMGNSDNPSLVIYWFYLDTSNDTATEVENADIGIGNSDYVYDVFIANSNIYSLAESHADILVYDVTGDAQVDGLGKTVTRVSFVVVIGNDAYFLEEDGGNSTMSFFDEGGASVTAMNTLNNYTISTDVNLRGLAYDGSNIISFVLKQTADGKNYRCEYSISAEIITVFAEYNIAFQMDRNNRAIVPNEFEKAFGIDNEIIYEIKARRGGIRQLQDCSGISDNDFIAITDNFLMNDDGDMFEFTDVTNEITLISYRGSII